MRGNLFSLAYLVSNAGALLILLISIWYKRAGRIIVGFLFLFAALVNAWQAIFKPDIYNVYELLAALPVYEYLVAEVFLIHITFYIILLMVVQLAIGIGIVYNRKIAMIAGIVYLLVLAPLGAGSSFPCTVILAVAVMLLLNRGKQN